MYTLFIDHTRDSIPNNIAIGVYCRCLQILYQIVFFYKISRHLQDTNNKEVSCRPTILRNSVIFQLILKVRQLNQMTKNHQTSFMFGHHLCMFP